MTEVANKKNKEEVIVGESRIDTKAVFYEPIDFSFKDMLQLSGKVYPITIIFFVKDSLVRTFV
jgi:hypothetical protein